MKWNKLLYLVLILLSITVLWNYKLLFFKDKELFDGVLLYENGEYPEWKLEFLIWSGANPLYKYKGQSTAIDSALWFKNFELASKISKNLSKEDKVIVFLENSTCRKPDLKSMCLSALSLNETDIR